ncbi:putative ribonuclease H-like domain-containing protein [Tanacetum coccineum]
MTHPHPNRRFVPQAVLTRSGKINTAGASVNTAVRPVNTAGSKPTVNHPRPISNAYKKGYSQVTRPFNKYSMSEVKKTDHSADVLASIRSQVPTAVDKYLGTKLDDALLKVLERHTADLIEKYSVLPGPESIQNQESEKSPKEIIRIKKEQGEEKQDSTYSIRSTDKVDLEEFDLKSALFKHMNKIKSANRNTANYRLYHALMEALIADEDAMDKEVADKVKDHKRKHDSDDDEDDDDDDEGPSAGSNQGKSAKRKRHDSGASGSAQPPTKDDEQSSRKPRESDASATKQHPALTSTGWQITDTRDAGADSSMHRSDPESEHSEQSSDDIPMQDEGNDSDIEDTDNAHIPKVSTTTWFKPIPESERPATPEPEWTIPPNDFPEPENNWANTYATTYKVPEENKLQRKTYDIGSFIKWFCRRTGKKKLCKADLEGPAFNLHKRLGHINFKNINKLVKGNLVRGLPSNIFENNHSCVACQKGKQHKASCKAKLVNSISKPLHMLHMDLFGPTNVKSLMKKSYCLVVTDDFSRFSWVFFLATKDETSRILKTFITEIENQLDFKVKVIRSDNGTEFKNSNGVAERRNRTLIEAARTMLVDSKLPTIFWAEVVNTACYVLNRVLVIKPHNKTPYELIRGRTLLIDFMKPFGCSVTILNTRDHLGKFDGKAEMDQDIVPGNQANGIVGTKDNIVTGQAEKKTKPEQEYILIPFCTTDPLISQGPKDYEEDSGMKPTEVDVSGGLDKDGRMIKLQEVSLKVNAAKTSEEHPFEQFSPFKNAITLPDVPNLFSIDDTGIFGNAYDDEDVGAEADLNNLETTMNVSPMPKTRIDKDH